ncbi:hypothetical protein ACFL43_05885 [Thermodesulfobacteriota bacterium]
MASLSVRKLEQRVYEKLRVRAAKHGVSMEEEARQIIAHVVAAPDRMSEVFKKHFGSKNGISLELPNQRTPHDPLDLSK